MSSWTNNFLFKPFPYFSITESHTLARGDHFFVWRHHRGVPFQHHAIDLGDGNAVHFTDGDGGVASPGADADAFEIQLTSIDRVTRDGRDSVHVVSHRQRLDPEVCVGRAMSQLGRKGYHVLFDNCEHFACWCVSDREESRQVTVACERLSAVGVKAIAATTVRAASSFGVKRAIRGASPWMLIADAAQWMTEAGGHHVGIDDPQKRKRAGRVVGATTALGVGACAGPAGVLVAGGIWVIGEMAGELSRSRYEQIRAKR